MINLNINFYLDENYFLLLPISIYTHCKMRCHYVEKRIYLIQTRYVLLQHACQKLANTCYHADFLPLIIFHSSNKSGETVEHVGNYSPEIGET